MGGGGEGTGEGGRGDAREGVVVEEVFGVRKDLGGVPEEQRKPGGQRGEILPRRLHAAASCVNVHQQAALTDKSGQECTHRC